MRNSFFRISLITAVFFASLCDAESMTLEDRQAAAKAVSDFQRVVKENDVKAFRKIIGGNGLIIIRNFISGNGQRGRDIRYYFRENKIERIRFDVRDEAPVIPGLIFKEAIAIDPMTLKMVAVSGENFLNFQDDGVTINPPTQVVTKKIASLLQGAGSSQEMPEMFVIGGKELVYTDAQIVLDMPVGSVALFEKINGRYLLRCIMEFL